MLPKFDLVKMWLWLAAFVGGIRRAVGIAAMNALADRCWERSRRGG
jgi:hypothetical protein